MKDKKTKKTKKTSAELRAFYEAKIAAEAAKKAKLWKTLGNCHVILGPPKNSLTPYERKRLEERRSP
tara:strand:+ start:157 stop:357 length:201 start_codon:yes stop_codon:yes gene_type:complete